MIKFYIKNKKIANIFVVILVIATAFLLVPTCYASVTSAALTVIGVFAQIIIYICGLFLTGVIKLILAIAEYNNFINEKPIIEAWTIIRDMCNMFFILILLIIAFATILRVESYNMKKWLPKLIIMAVLINFSKMICGLLIDVSQIIFLTFTSSLSNGSGLFTTLGVDKMVTAVVDNADESKAAGDGFFKSVGAMGAGIIFLVISTIVLLAVLVVILMRMVMFWIYVVLSPLAFLLSSFPGGQKYASQYWGEFTKYLVNGPILAFFIWLSLVAANGTNKIELSSSFGNGLDSILNSSNGTAKIFTGDVLLSYIIGVGMLVGGLIVSAQVGGMGASFGNNLLGKVKGQATGVMKAGALWGGRKTWGATKATGRVGLAVASGVDRLAGKGIDSLTGGRLGLGGEGLVKKTVQGTWNAPGNLKKWASDKLTKDSTLNKARRSVFGEKAGATMTYGDRDWKKDKNGEFFQVDGAGKAKLDGSNKRVYLKKDEKNPGSERVKEMGSVQASLLDGWNSAQSGAKATANKAQEESMNKEQQKIADSGMTETDMLRQLKDVSTSKDKKMALAMTLAIKEGFKSLDDVKAARKAMGSNHLLGSKLNEQIDKGQAHIAYDFDTDAGREKFKNRIDSGKIDSTKLSAGAYSNDKIVEQLQDYHGKNFKKVMETTFKRGKKYENSVASGLVKRRNANTGDEKYAMASLHAKLTGDPGTSFKNRSGGGIDIASMEKYFRTAKAVDTNKISVENFDKMINSASSPSGASRSIANAMTFAKLKALHKQGDNPELARKMKELMMLHGKAKDQAEITKDSELSTI